MEGLYHNNVYQSSAYMMQHSDQSTYYPPITLPYRNSSAFSDTTTNSSNNRPYHYLPSSSHHHSTSNNISSSSSTSSSSITSSPPLSSSLSLLNNHHPYHSTTTTTTTNNNTTTNSNHSSPSIPHHSIATTTTSQPVISSPPSLINGGWTTSTSTTTSIPSWSHSITPNYIRNIPSHPYGPPTTSYYSSPYHHHHTPIQRPKLTTTVWEDEGTLCYQVDAKSICVARRQDNDMINGTKLLNVVGMSRGKRDGILKNEKGRVVVKVGAMHLKGVWITFERAKDLAAKFKITDLLYPLFTDDPNVFLCASNVPASNLPITSTLLPPTTNSSSNMIVPSSRSMPSFQYRTDTYGFMSPWERPSHDNTTTTSTHSTLDHHESFTNILRDHHDLPSGSCSPVPTSNTTTTNGPLMNSLSTSTNHHQEESDLYLLNNSYEYPPRSTSSNHSEYDSLSRKSSIIKVPPPSSAYPHSPPQEDLKHHSLSHPISSSSWSSPSLTSQLNSLTSDIPKLNNIPTSTKQPSQVVSNNNNRKRSFQSTSSNDTHPTTTNDGTKKRMKRS
ncbi:unnamed protein product [Cunninghamella blakesleeana]